MKSDLEDSRTVTEKEGQEKAFEFNMSYVEISSKTGHNIEQLIKLLLDNFKDSFEQLKEKARQKE